MKVIWAIPHSVGASGLEFQPLTRSYSVYIHTLMPGPPTASEARRIGAACACFAVRRAARSVTQLYDEALRPTGLRATQLSILAAIRALEPVAVSRLASVTGTDRTTMSRNLHPLEACGLVRIARAGDRRVHQIRLTARGERKLRGALPLWQQAQDRVASELGETRVRRLLRDLEAAASLGEPPPVT